MSLSALRPQLAAILASLTLVACGGGGSSAPAPTDVAVDPGDGQITVTWTAAPGVDYWLAYAAADSVSTDKNSPHLWASPTAVSSPFVLKGLVNGTTYAVTLNGRIDGGPGGPDSPSVSTVPRPGGSSWNPGTALGQGAMHGVSYQLISSSDGVTVTTTPTYLAVGDGSALYQSQDGKSWSPITTGPSGVDFQSSAYLNTTYGFVVVGSGGAVYHSTDLSTWTPGTSATTQTLHAVAGNGSIAVAVGDNGTIRLSGDGSTWTAAASVPTSAALYGVSYTASGKWLAVGANGTLLSSSDGSSWTAVSSGTTQTLRSVASTYLSAVTTVSPGVASYAIVGDAGTVLTSADGASWQPATINATPTLTANLSAVVGSASQFLAVGAGGTVLTSANGTTWTATTSGGTGIDALGLVFAPSPQAQYVAVGSAGANSNSH